MQAGNTFQEYPTNGHTYADVPSAGSADPTADTTEPKKGGLKLRPLIGVAGRNIPLILLVTGVFGTLGVLNYIKTAPSYEGSFEILVEPISSQARATDPTAISRAQSNQDNSTVDYPTLLQVLQSPELLSKISAQIQSRYPDVSAASLARDLKKQNFTVARVGTNILDSTRTIQVGYTGSDPQEVQFVLEKLAEGYLRFSLEDRKTRIGGGVEFIEDQLPALQQRVNALESQIQAIRQRYRFTDPEIENQQVADQLRDVRKEKLTTETALREQATLMMSLQRQLGLGPDQALAAASLSQNPLYQDLLQQLTAVEAKIATNLARYNEASPVVQRLRDQERNLNRLIGQEAATILSGTAPNVARTSNVLAFQDEVRVGLIRQLVASTNQTQALQARNNQIIQTENELDQRLTQLPAIVRQYNTLQQQLDIATKTLNQFLLQRETLRVEAAQKEVPWEIISKPKLASDPATGQPLASRGKKAKPMLMATVLAGVAVGFLAALLREKMRNAFVTSTDLEDGVQVPFLGAIPPSKGVDGFANGLVTKGSNPIADSFAALYTNLRFLESGLTVRNLAIGSVAPGDGKTTVALNLARTAASMGQRVLLVDANLIAPQLHTLLMVPNQRGLTDVLRYRVSPEDVIQPVISEDNLSVLTTGPVQPHSTKLFASPELKSLIRHFRETYDLVIYDLPELAGQTDVNFLAAHTDGILMVVGLNKTKRSQFKQVSADLKRYHQPILGVVANSPSRKHGRRPAGQFATLDEVPSAFFGKLKESQDAVK